MSIEDLLKYDASQLEAMSLEDKRKFFEPYLKFIVPIIKKDDDKPGSGKISSGGRSASAKTKSPADMEKMLALSDRLAKQLGLKI